MDGTFCTDEDVAGFFNEAIYEIADHCDINQMEALDVLDDGFCEDKKYGQGYNWKK